VDNDAFSNIEVCCPSFYLSGEANCPCSLDSCHSAGDQGGDCVNWHRIGCNGP
jgi:hypothetical protein